jgi:hypothetical protein
MVAKVCVNCFDEIGAAVSGVLAGVGAEKLSDLCFLISTVAKLNYLNAPKFTC